MIDKLAELNRVLFAVSTLRDEKNAAEKGAVILHCKGVVIEGRMPDHEMTIEFSGHIGLIEQRRNRIKLTPDGEMFLELNPEGLYDLSDQQKRFILRKCFLDGPFRDETLECLREFSASAKGKTLRWSEIDSSPMKVERWVPEHLHQLGFLRRGKDWLEVTSAYVDTVSVFLSETRGWTEEQHLEYLREKKDLGNLAEDLIVDFEIDRLRKLGCMPESGCVHKISKLKVNAGYDIESFNGKSKAMEIRPLHRGQGLWEIDGEIYLDTQ